MGGPLESDTTEIASCSLQAQPTFGVAPALFVTDACAAALTTFDDSSGSVRTVTLDSFKEFGAAVS